MNYKKITDLFEDIEDFTLFVTEGPDDQEVKLFKKNGIKLEHVETCDDGYDDGRVLHYDIMSFSNLEDLNDIIYVQFDYYYQSFYGHEVGEYRQVKPVEVTVTQWEEF